MTFEILKEEMNLARREGDKRRVLVLGDMISSIERATTSGSTRLFATEKIVNDVLIKYKKTMQEMIDTCPATREDLLDEYEKRMNIVRDYAPQSIDNVEEISAMIDKILAENGNPAQMSTKIRIVMPKLKSMNCNMKLAKEILSTK